MADAKEATRARARNRWGIIGATMVACVVVLALANANYEPWIMPDIEGPSSPLLGGNDFAYGWPYK